MERSSGGYLSEISTSGKKTVTANQEVNPDILEKMGNYYNKPGVDILHEVVEGYLGGVNAQNSGTASPSSSKPGSNYESVHEFTEIVAPQSGPQTYEYLDPSGNVTSRTYRGGTIKYYAEDPRSKTPKAPLLLQAVIIQ